jgi:acyl carrier protein
MKEIEEWDSLGHLAILVALDKKFNGKVSKIDEMASADTVKKIINLLKLNKLI